MRCLVGLGLISLLIPCSAAFSQDDILAEVQDIPTEEIKWEGFRLDSEQDIRIEAVGFKGPRRHESSFTDAWILDSSTREVVWEMEDAEVKNRTGSLSEVEEDLRLARGSYEVYYSSFPDPGRWNHDGFGTFIGKIFDEIFDHEDYEDVYDDYKGEWKEFRIVVHGKGKRYREAAFDQLQDSFRKDAFVSMAALGDDEYLHQGFKLEKPAEIQVYAIGEARRDGTFDYGWIVNAETREKVWSFTHRHSEPAGGSLKNRVVNKVISLPAGEYAAYFVTDDSHSYRRWNSAPPHDPMFWGLTLRVADPAMKRYVKLYDIEDLPQKNVIVKLTKLRNDAFRSKGFTLNKPMDLRIYAIGEGRNGGMFDYGWIVDAKTHEKVWEMEYYDTEHAGGGKKNRLFDGVVHFNKGSYFVYFVTDGSHSYRNWNTTPPFDQKGWGITVLAASEKFNPDDVTEYREEEDGSVLAKLVRVRNHEYEKANFTLGKDGKIRIYAIGEGMDGEMYDYGWIEDANTGRTVWEMTYRKTEHAGGARKNRLVDDIILLQRGDYTVYYESDDSHAFNHWNDDPPYDPVHWGITVYLAPEK